MTSQAEKCRVFRALHEDAGAFVIPNPWDIGSALYLQGLGFKALATTSAGAAFSFGRAVERVRAARAAIDASGMPVVFTARAEAVLLGLDGGFEEALKRLVAFAAAGADCLYAPGLRTAEQVAAVVKAVAPRPVNVL